MIMINKNILLLGATGSIGTQVLDVIRNNDFVVNSYEIKKEELPYDLSEIVNTLPEKYKTIIILHYYDDMKIKDISSVLKISESAVKKRLERARDLLKDLIERKM